MGIQVKGYQPTKDEEAKYGQQLSNGLAADKSSIPSKPFEIKKEFRSKYESDQLPAGEQNQVQRLQPKV